MKSTSFAGLAIKIALFYFTAAGFCQNLQAQSDIRFRLSHDVIIIVPVMADQQGPFDFVFDTGADTTVLDTELASKLSLAAESHIQQTTLPASRP